MPWSILKLLREDPEALKEHVRKRLLDPSIVDEAVELDREWRRLQTVINELRHKHNVITRAIAKAKDPQERTRLIQEAKNVIRELEELERRFKEVE